MDGFQSIPPRAFLVGGVPALVDLLMPVEWDFSEQRQSSQEGGSAGSATLGRGYFVRFLKHARPRRIAAIVRAVAMSIGAATKNVPNYNIIQLRTTYVRTAAVAEIGD